MYVLLIVDTAGGIVDGSPTCTGQHFVGCRCSLKSERGLPKELLSVPIVGTNSAFVWVEAQSNSPIAYFELLLGGVLAAGTLQGVVEGRTPTKGRSNKLKGPRHMSKANAEK